MAVPAWVGYFLFVGEATPREHAQRHPPAIRDSSALPTLVLKSRLSKATIAIPGVRRGLFAQTFLLGPHGGGVSWWSWGWQGAAASAQVVWCQGPESWYKMSCQGLSVLLKQSDLWADKALIIIYCRWKRCGSLQQHISQACCQSQQARGSLSFTREAWAFLGIQLWRNPMVPQWKKSHSRC